MKRKYFYSTDEGWVNLTYIQRVYISDMERLNGKIFVECKLLDEACIIKEFHCGKNPNAREDAEKELEKVLDAIEAVYENS